ncbi:MAG: GGDEF domain-containing protein, partial [Gemmatimonadetes bacterium]|nr:GGDEF domain-containing protein [Gemmatimonadota bacterium]
PLGLVWAQAPRKNGSVVVEARRVPLAVAGGEERSFELTMTPLGPRGGRGSTVLVLRDVAERERLEAALREANEELERLANTDVLTGLANRRRFMAALETEIERARRYGRAFALVLLDLDRFKLVNDTHGHATGDQVLRSIGPVLREASRDIDVPARLGGEELAMLLPETTADGARALAERLRHGIARQRHESPTGTSFSVTASLGVAVFGPGQDDAEALLHAADEALYAAKDGGRNRVVMAPGPDAEAAAS